MLFYMYLFISVIVADCIFSINLFFEKKKKIKKKKSLSKAMNSLDMLDSADLIFISRFVYIKFWLNFLC